MLLDVTGTRVKTGDFGLSKDLMFSKLTDRRATFAYMAPELFHEEIDLHELNLYEADVYSLGMTFWEVLYRKRPFGGLTEAQIYKKVVAGGERLSMEDFIWEKEVLELIKKSWIAMPHERCALPNYIYTLNTVLQEPTNFRNHLSVPRQPVFDLLIKQKEWPALKEVQQALEAFMKSVDKNGAIVDSDDNNLLPVPRKRFKSGDHASIRSPQLPSEETSAVHWSSTESSQMQNRKRIHLQEHYEPPRQVVVIADELTTKRICRNQLKIDGTLLGEGSQGRVYKAYHPFFGIVAYKELPYHKKLAEGLQDMGIEDKTKKVEQKPEAPKRTPIRLMASIQKKQLEGKEKGEAAVKKIDYEKNEKRELMYTNKLDNHPNILKFLAYVVDDDNGKCTGMILEYMDQGTVARAISTPGILHISRIKGWFLQLARALQYCHDAHRVIHRDVKTDNALLCDNWCTLKLYDFGFARDVQPNMEEIYPFMEIVEQEVINDQGEKEIKSIWSSIKVSYKKTLDNKLESSDTETALLKDENFFRTFLLQHNDEDEDKEDEFRPKINLDAIFARFNTGKEDRSYYLQDDELHLRMMVWLMKKCWRTNPEARPTMKQIVDLLDFHFQSPLSLYKGDNGEILLKNTSFYPVWLKLYVYKVEEGEKTKMVRLAHERKVEKRLLEPKEKIDIGFNPLIGTIQLLLCQYTPDDTKDIAFAKDWTYGLVTFVIDFPIVPLVDMNIVPCEDDSS